MICSFFLIKINLIIWGKLSKFSRFKSTSLSENIEKYFKFLHNIFVVVGYLAIDQISRQLIKYIINKSI